MTIYRLEAVRTQWAVGHGFFHTGTVRSGEHAVAYGYDCGSLAKYADALSREIEEAASRHRRLDLVFISHFDYDHVSGLKALASRVGIGSFVIPLIDRAERLFHLAARLAASGDASTLDEAEDWYWDFLSNPRRYLERLLDSELVVEIGDSQEEVDPRQEETFFAEDGLAPQELKSSTEGALNIERNGRDWVVKCAGDPVWQFSARLLPRVQDYAERFIKQLLDKNIVSKESDLNDADFIRDLVLNHADALKAEYVTFAKGFGKSFTPNLTSLMVYSGPRLNTRFASYRKRGILERAEIVSWGPSPGWLGCGDATIDAASRREQFNEMFRQHKRLSGIFAPPHHGSKKEWHVSLLDGFGRAGNAIPVCVFAAAGDYGHPSHQAILAVNGLGGTALVVTDQERSRWTDSMSIFVENDPPW